MGTARGAPFRSAARVEFRLCMRAGGANGAVWRVLKGAPRPPPIVAGEKSSWLRAAARRLPPAGLMSIAGLNFLIPSPSSPRRRLLLLRLRTILRAPAGRGIKWGIRWGINWRIRWGIKCWISFFILADQGLICLTKKLRLTGFGLKIREQKIPIFATLIRRSVDGRSTGGGRLSSPPKRGRAPPRPMPVPTGESRGSSFLSRPPG